MAIGLLGAACGGAEGPRAAAGTGSPAAAEPSAGAARPARTPSSRGAGSAVERLRAQVVATHPHATDAFTQGLVLDRGELFESVGRYGVSALRRVELGTGAVEREARLSADLFAEGLAAAGERLVQLTWREGVAIVWDRASFEELDRWSYAGEGWGLCWDGSRFFLSDGGAELSVRHGETFAELDRVPVRERGRPVAGLNELECAEGWVWANVYRTDRIVRIDPASGAVTATVDASGLLTPAERAATDVLNGIAYDPASGHFLLTGKLWPYLFEVVFR